MIGGIDMWGNMMATQQLLDGRICREHGISFERLNAERFLATTDEILEYAKETKCFKYWSVKEPSEIPVRLEEFVDGIHFYLSRGNELGTNPDDFLYASHAAKELAKEKQNAIYIGAALSKNAVISELLMDAIFHLMRSAKIQLMNEKRASLFHSLTCYLAVGRLDGFNDRDVEKAYYIKNRENQNRQNTGY